MLVDFQAAAQDPAGKADYADVFLAAWMAELAVSEPDFADLNRGLIINQALNPAGQARL